MKHKRTFKEILKAHLPEDLGLDKVDIWFQDETRVGQQGSLTRMWAEKGTRPRVARQQQFNYTYIFGAVCPTRDIAVGLVMPYVNSNTMQVGIQLKNLKNLRILPYYHCLQLHQN